MRGIDFSETHYRRLYSPTPTFKLLGRPAQCVYWALRNVFDAGGFFKLDGSSAAEALAVEIGWFTKDDLQFIAAGIERLLEKQWIYYVPEEDALFDPAFYESEHATKSDRQRAKEYRQRGKAIRAQIEQSGQASLDPSKILSGRSTDPATAAKPVPMPTSAKKTTALKKAAAATAEGIGFKMPGKTSLAEASPDEAVPNRQARAVTRCDASVTVDQKPHPSSKGEPCPLAVGGSAPVPATVQSAAQAKTQTGAQGASVTFRDAGVTKCDAPVTRNAKKRLCYLLPNTYYPAAKAASEAPVNPYPDGSAGERCRSELASEAPVNPYPDGTAGERRASRLAAKENAFQAASAPAAPPAPVNPPPDRAAGGRRASELTADSAFQEYREQIAAIFAEVVGQDRRFSPAEGGLIIDWYKRGISLQVIAETLPERARHAHKPVGDLRYFRKAVSEAWTKARKPQVGKTAQDQAPTFQAAAPASANPCPDGTRVGSERAADPVAPAPKAPKAPVNPSPARSAGNRTESELATDPAFQHYSGQIAAIFTEAVGQARPFSSAEGKLILDWYKRGISLQVIAETLPDRARHARKPVGTLLYYRNAVPEAWARDRELRACEIAHDDVPTIDFEARLERLIEMLKPVPELAAKVASLRGQAQSNPEQTEEALKAFEAPFLDALELSPAHQENWNRSVAWLAKNVDEGVLAFQKVRIARHFKREALGIPSLSFFDPLVTGEARPSQQVPA